MCRPSQVLVGNVYSINCQHPSQSSEEIDVIFTLIVRNDVAKISRVPLLVARGAVGLAIRVEVGTCGKSDTFSCMLAR